MELVAAFSDSANASQIARQIKGTLLSDERPPCRWWCITLMDVRGESTAAVESVLSNDRAFVVAGRVGVSLVAWAYAPTKKAAL